MKTQFTKLSLTAPIIVFILTGCASTRLQVTYRDEGYSNKPLDKVLVLGIAADQDRRRIFEDQLAGDLKDAKVEAIQSYEVFPSGRNWTVTRSKPESRTWISMPL